MIVGVTKIRMLVFVADFEFQRNSQPSSGMSPSSGTFFLISLSSLRVRPAITIVCPSGTVIVVLTIRFEIVGTYWSEPPVSVTASMLGSSSTFTSPPGMM